MGHREWERWWKGAGEEELRELLMRAWDPIGVRDEPLAYSEYDSYLQQIFSKLRAGGTQGRFGTTSHQCGLGWALTRTSKSMTKRRVL